jgi:hypothetical protein
MHEATEFHLQGLRLEGPLLRETRTYSTYVEVPS